MTQTRKKNTTSVTLRQQDFLAVLRSKREWTVTKVAKAFDISLAAASKMLSRLERQGKIQRFVDPDDRRYRIIQVIDEEEKTFMDKKEYQLLQKKPRNRLTKRFSFPIQELSAADWNDEDETRWEKYYAGPGRLNLLQGKLYG